MKSRISYEVVPQDGDDVRVRALDQSEKEYNRMISQHTTYHKSLMDNLLQLSSGSGSGSNNAEQDTNLIRDLAATTGNLNATDQRIMNTVSDFIVDTKTNEKTVSRLNNFILQNTSKLNKTIDDYQALNIEGFANQNQTMDAALEVSNIVKESHKYAFFIFGIVAIYALYKTTKQL